MKKLVPNRAATRPDDRPASAVPNDGRKPLPRDVDPVRAPRAARFLPIEPLMNTRDVAEVTGEREQTIRLRRMKGNGVPFVRCGSRAYYHPEDVREWLRSRRFQSTSEETVAREAETSAPAVAPTKRSRGGAR